MKGKPIRIFTTTWCGDCFRAKSFLDRNGVRYEEVDIEKNEAALQTIMNANGGKRRVPTFEIDGQFRLLPEKVKDAWAHPVLLHGKLYLRYHDSLWCYDVRRARL